MIDDQYDHTNRPTYHDVHQVNEQRGQSPLHKDRFDEVIRKLGPYSFKSIPRKLFNHRDRDSRKESPLHDVLPHRNGMS